MAFPILAALARKPMARKELAQTLQISQSAISRRLAELVGQNLIIKGEDKKYHPMVILRMEAPPAPESIVDNKIPAGQPVGPAVIEPAESFAAVPQIEPAKPKPVAYKAPEPEEEVSPQVKDCERRG
jgi:DNA-binding transcriptional ArsR family regulator